MQTLLWTAILAFSILSDQITKYFVIEQVKPVGTRPFLEGIVRFRYTENTGAAFGIFKNHPWIFIAATFLAVFLILFYLFRNHKRVPLFLGISLSMIAGGGIGNQIDRLARGYVVDFIDLQFMNFAIFNVADCFVTVGCFLVILDLLFFHRDFSLLPEKGPNGDPKKGKKSASTAPNEAADGKASGEAAPSGAGRKTDAENPVADTAVNMTVSMTSGRAADTAIDTAVDTVSGEVSDKPDGAASGAISDTVADTSADAVATATDKTTAAQTTHGKDAPNESSTGG